MNQKRKNTVLTLSQFLAIAFIVAIGLGTILVLILDRQARISFTSAYHTNISNELAARSQVLEEVIENRRKEIRFLHDTPPIQGIVRATQNNGIDPTDKTTLNLWVARLETIFEAYLTSYPEIMQARYIGIAENGKELVRVDRNSGNIETYSDRSLQKKSEEQYYKEVVSLRPDEIYFSDINLNREYGKIEFPYWPTYRVAEPVYDNDYNIFGFVILNYQAQPLLDSITSNLEDDLQLFLFNSNGGYLAHPNKEMAFAFEHQENATWSDEFSNISTKIGSDDFSVGRNKTSQDSLYFLKNSIPLSDYSAGRSLNLSIGVADSTLAAAVSKNRVSVILFLTAAMIAIFIILTFYQNEINKKIQLLHNEAEFKAIFKSSSDAIISMDADGIVNSWNIGAETTFGFSEKMAVGKPIFSIFLKNGSPDLSPSLLRDVFKGEIVKEIETTANTYSNRILTIAVTLSPISLDDEEKIIGVAAIIRDISNKKSTESQLLNLNTTLENRVQKRTEELELARNQALAASKTKSEFIANVSHEIRTPMNGVLGMLRLLEREPLNKKQHRLVDMAETSANALTSLLNDILDMSKIEAGKLDLEEIGFNLISLFSEVSSSLGLTSYEKGLDFVLDLSAIEHEWVFGDANRLRQVLVNLIGNAFKFTDEGEIRVRAETTTSEVGDVKLFCSVEDTGIGISSEKLQGLFESFGQEDSSVSRRFGGTGLGLTISKQLCSLMGGEISVVSEKSKGSNFSFSILLRNNNQIAKTFSENALPKMQVLLLTSRPTLAQAITAQLQAWSIKTQTISLIEDYQTLSEKEKDDAKLVIIDDVLQDGPGINFAEQLTASNSEKTAILMRPPHVNTRSQNSFDELIKPVRPFDLWRIVASFSGLEIGSEGAPAHNRLPKTIQDNIKSLQGSSVLLVDDNAINLEVAQGLIEDYGVSVLQADSGQTALELLNSNNQIDLILLDCQMPEMDGYATARAIRKGQAGEIMKVVPIVAMTANAMAGAREKCLQAGMNDYLAKPINPEELEEKLVRYLKKKAPRLLDTTSPPKETLVEVAKDPVWDRAGLVQRLNGREDRVGRLLNLFLKDLPAQCENLHTACLPITSTDSSSIPRESFSEIKALAHRIRGSAGNLGAVQLFEICTQLEHSADNNETENVLAAYGNFQDAVNLLTPQMENYLSSNT